MKITFILLAFYGLLSTAVAQQKFPVASKAGPVNYRVTSLSSKIPIYLATDKQTKYISPFNAIPNDPLGTMVYLEGATNVSVTTQIKKDSLNYYRYSIFENDTTVIQANAKLSKVDFTWPDHSDLPGYLTINFGISNVKNKKVTITMYRLPEENKVTTLIIYNKRLNHAKLVQTTLISKGRVTTKTLTDVMPIIRTLDEVIHLKNGFEVNVDKKTQGISLTMEKTDLDFLYYVSLKNKSGDKENLAFLSNNWNYSGAYGNPVNFIPVSYFSEPGSYELIVTPMLGSRFEMTDFASKQVKLSFSVVKPVVTLSSAEIAIVLIAVILLTGATMFLVTRNDKRKLTMINRQAEIAKTELTNVRSQLNPHFVFNALGGIQNLMNQNEIEKANSYLARFARLTRSILNEKQLIALNDEHKLLDDYLAMERLRFSFNYGINIENNVMEVMIPVMLLQPFVENAVKHSMSKLGDKGILTVDIKSNQKDLFLRVKDNGEGFDIGKTHKGLGLSLCKKRIDLLNQMYRECPLSLNIHADLNGTTVLITLKNWL